MIERRYLLGPVGKLRALPMVPVGDRVRVGYGRAGGIHDSLTGALTLDVLGPVKRTWEMRWSCLDAPEAAVVKAAYLGLVRSTLRLVDPGQTNRLGLNVSSGGSALRTTEGFVASTGAVAVVQPSMPDLPVDSAIQWTPAVSGTLSGTEIPITTETCTLSAYVTGTGDASLRVSHLDDTGAEVAASLGQVQTLDGGWRRLTVLVPVVGVLGVPQLTASAAVTTTGWQWQAGELTEWEPGLGCPVVIVTEHADSVPGVGYGEPALTVREV